MTRWYMGIDGGGSNVRAAIVDETLTPIATVTHAQTANPSSVGREVAASVVQSAIRIVLRRASMTPDQIDAAGIGVAGASAEYAADWLRAVVSTALPDAQIAPSSDIEIALVGAMAQRRGVIVLAGTGSVAYGINAEGQSVQVGGWGYLLGDAGGGFWLSAMALRHITQQHDTTPQAPSRLCQRVLEALDLPNGRALVGYVYSGGRIDVRGIAELASLVLEEAEDGEPNAARIVEEGADALTELVRNVQARLNIAHDPQGIAFAGGLLQSENALSRALCARLGMDAIPQPTYPPVIGAALLAKLTFEESLP